MKVYVTPPKGGTNARVFRKVKNLPFGGAREEHARHKSLILF